MWGCGYTRLVQYSSIRIIHAYTYHVPRLRFCPVPGPGLCAGLKNSLDVRAIDIYQHNERDVKKIRDHATVFRGLRELSEISGIIPENPGGLAGLVYYRNAKSQ